MDKRWVRLGGWALIWVMGCTLWWWSGEPTATASSEQWTVPPAPPILVNGGFECTNGFTLTQNEAGKDIWIPNGWTVDFVLGSPRLLSTRLSATNVCHPDSGGHVTRQEGHDSWYLPSQDIAAPPLPGKRFDLVLYQQVPATYGGAYSLSGWMASECGGSGGPACPQGYYVAKAIGIDPNGGIDYASPAIEWVENRQDRHWQNLFTSATALTDTITIFARVTSPFQFNNNKGFVDAFTLLRAPLSALNTLSPTVKAAEPLLLSWDGEQSADVAGIANGKFELRFDLQARPLPGGVWDFLVENSTEQSLTFAAPCLNARYQFRVRARAEQPEGSNGSSPDHSYFGVWTKPQTVLFTAPSSVPITDSVPISNTSEFSPSIFIPFSASTTAGGC